MYEATQNTNKSLVLPLSALHWCSLRLDCELVSWLYEQGLRGVCERGLGKKGVGGDVDHCVLEGGVGRGGAGRRGGVGWWLMWAKARECILFCAV